MSSRLFRFAALCAAMAVLLTACASQHPPEPSPSPSPAGYAPTGRDNPDVPPNPYRDAAFVAVGGFTIYTGMEGASHIGVDVSDYQGEIDWPQVKAAGVEFAIIRAGFRGYTGGGIYGDSRFADNIQGALDAGLEVGAYFFSQAVSPQEAREEAQALLAWVEPYAVTYPLVFDWETIPGADARTNDVAAETVTECVKAFCDTVADAGHVPMVYFNRTQGYSVMDLAQLGDYHFWLAGYSAVPGFDYDFAMWQYSCTGTVPGIAVDVDLNLCLTDSWDPAGADSTPAPGAPPAS